MTIHGATINASNYDSLNEAVSEWINEECHEGYEIVGMYGLVLGGKTTAVKIWYKFAEDATGEMESGK